jgi:hypothetical protein
MWLWSDRAFKPGCCDEIYFVAGGTVDIAAHQLSHDSTGVTEFMPPSGDRWGSSLFNDGYCQFLQAVVPNLQEFRQSDPGAFSAFGRGGWGE